MKTFCLTLILLLTLVGTAQACTSATIDAIVNPINPYETSLVGDQMATALDTLGLCDENLQYAGVRLGQKFNPYESTSTQIMSQIVVSKSPSILHEMNYGLALGMIAKLNLYELNSTVTMLNAIVSLGRSARENAKTYALELLKKQNAYEANANSYLLQAVRDLKNLAPQPVQPPPQVIPVPVASPIWAFRSNNEACNGLTGPWGYYELCPRYYASVSDQFGNRIVLACKAENFGIEFRVTMSPSYWSRVANTNIETLAFGTSSTLQSLGAPYMIGPANTLMTQEPVAPEILNELRHANNLLINVRSNSGEVNTRLSFALKGSNIAIGQLLQYCH